MSTVRKVAAGDACLEEVAALEILAWGGELDPARVQAERAGLESLLAETDAADLAMLVVERGGTVLGVCRVRREIDEAGVWLAYGLAVHPSHRRQGLARLLYQAALEHARARGAVTFRAYTHEDNQASRAFHEAMGLGPGVPTVAPDGDRLISYAVSIDTLS